MPMRPDAADRRRGADFGFGQLPGAARDLSRSLDERPANHIFPKTLLRSHLRIARANSPGILSATDKLELRRI